MDSKGIDIVCRGGSCDNVARCISAGRCTYKSSAEEARELLRAEGQSCGMCQSPGCVQCFPPGSPIRLPHPYDEKGWNNLSLSTALPTDSKARKDIPLARGVLDYFPAALAAVAELSRIGNEKHNPGEDLHWARGKSTDHADCIMRHLVERGKIDTDGLSHTVKVAWRALALLQEELEQTQGAPLPRAARLP